MSAIEADRTERTWVRRSFSTFAPGWPGIGLLVLRTALGAPLFAEGVALLVYARNIGTPLLIVALVSAIAGICLQLGYVTAGSGIVGAASSILLHCISLQDWPLNLFASRFACFLAVSIAIALVMLGPGAFSVDARLFGRREIVFPPHSTRDR